MEEGKNVEINKKELKPYHGVILLVLSAIAIFIISPKIGQYLGMWGSLAGELLLLVSAVLVTVIFRGDLKKVFPIKRPKIIVLFGTFLMWFATYQLVGVLTMIMTYFFPEQVIGVSQNLEMAFTSMPILIAIGMIAVSPAICEEAVFRGVVLNSFRSSMNKWLAICLTGIVFGSFHGNIWRAVPTSVLGMVLAYILFETDNLVYTVFFHFINNLVPLIVMFASQGILSEFQMGNEMEIPLLTVAISVIQAAGVPFIMYIGSFLIHKGGEKEREKLFPKESRKSVIVLAVSTVLFIVTGVILAACAMIFDREFFTQIINNM